jgi:hypothetical protein
MLFCFVFNEIITEDCHACNTYMNKASNVRDLYANICYYKLFLFEIINCWIGYKSTMQRFISRSIILEFPEKTCILSPWHLYLYISLLLWNDTLYEDIGLCSWYGAMYDHGKSRHTPKKTFITAFMV